jgi:hypothetical protein
MTICSSEVGCDVEMDRPCRFELSAAPGMPAPNPVVPVWTSTGMRSSDAASHSGYTRGRPARSPARADGASGRADQHAHRRSSSVTAARRPWRIDGGEADEGVRMVACGRATKSFVTGGRPVLVSASREEHAEDVDGEHVGHLVHSMAQECRSEVGLARRTEVAPSRRRRTPGSTGGRGSRSPRHAGGAQSAAVSAAAQRRIERCGR